MLNVTFVKAISELGNCCNKLELEVIPVLAFYLPLHFPSKPKPRRLGTASYILANQSYFILLVGTSSASWIQTGRE